MAQITLKGNPIQTVGQLPELGSQAPAFTLTGKDLADVGLAAFAGKRKLLNIVPSLDTGVCAASARRFNAAANEVPGAVMITISRDLPFAQGRFCESEGLANVVTLSELRALEFGEAWGVRISTGPLAGLLSRAVVVLDVDDRVLYTEQVPEIVQEPDYERALLALRG